MQFQGGGDKSIYVAQLGASFKNNPDKLFIPTKESTLSSDTKDVEEQSSAPCDPEKNNCSAGNKNTTTGVCSNQPINSGSNRGPEEKGKNRTTDSAVIQTEMGQEGNCCALRQKFVCIPYLCQQSTDCLLAVAFEVIYIFFAEIVLQKTKLCAYLQPPQLHLQKVLENLVNLTISKNVVLCQCSHYH